MRFLTAALFTMALGSGAQAEYIPGSDIGYGNWRGAAYTFDDTGAFSHCVVSAGFVSGEELYLSVNGDATVTVGVYSPNIRLQTGQTIPVTLKVDRRAPFNGTATAVNEQFMVLNLPQFEAAMTALQKGQTLYLDTSIGSSNFDLTGTNRALSATLDCAIKWVGYQGQPKTTPAKPQPETMAASGIPAAKLQEAVNAILTEFSVTNFYYLQGEEKSYYVSGDGVVWSLNDSTVLGGIFAEPATGMSNIADKDATDLIYLIAGCEGGITDSAHDLQMAGLPSRAQQGTCSDASGVIDGYLAKTWIGNDILYTFLFFNQNSPIQSVADRSFMNEHAALVAAEVITGTRLTGAGGVSAGAPPPAPTGRRVHP